MNRIVVMTVGKTHSGKTTFAKQLEMQLTNAVVIDQDNHASFINAYYKSLQPKQGPNELKHAVTQTIVDYAVSQTSYHLILSNANFSRQGRIKLVERFRREGFVTILVYFNIPIDVLRLRITESQRSKDIFRKASSFEEVLDMQLNRDEPAPDITEADYLFVINRNEDDVPSVINKIIELASL